MLFTYSCVGNNGLNSKAVRCLMPSYMQTGIKEWSAPHLLCMFHTVFSTFTHTVQDRKAWWVEWMPARGDTQSNPRHPVLQTGRATQEHAPEKTPASVHVLHVTGVWKCIRLCQLLSGEKKSGLSCSEIALPLLQRCSDK